MDKRASMHWPSYLHLSSDHTHPRWRFQSHRRLKNIVVMMEWSPDVDAGVTGFGGAAPFGAAAAGATQLAAAAFTDSQRTRLTRIFELYDPERLGALSELQLLLVLREMGLSPDEDATDVTAAAPCTRDS